MSRALSSSRLSWAGFVVALTLLGAGFLVGPRVPDALQQANCVGNVDLPGPFGFGLNCDGPVFMSLARDPEAILRPDCSRQSRPGLIFLAALLHAPLARLADPARPVARFTYRWTDNPGHITESFEVDFWAFVAYSALNVAMLLGVFACLRAITRSFVRPGAPTVALWAVGVVLVSNDVTKAFFWAPHTQLLNILGPVFALYAAVRVRDQALARTRFALGLGLALGLGMTVYGVFAITLPAVGIAALVAIRRAQRPGVAARTLWNYALVVVLTALPSVLWYEYVVHETGQFFNQELRMGHVVWMRDAWRVGAGHLASEWLENLRELGALAAPQAIPAAVLLGLALLVALEARALRPLSARTRSIALLALLVSGLAGAFYASVGFITARLAFAMVPSLVVLAGACAIALTSVLDARRRWAVAAVCATIAVVCAVYAVVKDGPYS